MVHLPAGLATTPWPADGPGDGKSDVGIGIDIDDNDNDSNSNNDFVNLSIHEPPPPEKGDPLLPGRIARSISFGTGSIRGAVRTARSVGRVPFQVARYTTAASIEAGRLAFDVVLGETGRSLYAQYAGGGGGASGSDNNTAREADRLRVASVLETTFDAAHRGFHYLQLFTAAGFELTGSSVATLMDLSEVVLLLVDSTLGSTESSRALRSIINFMSLEFQNPATGLPGERVGFRDLMWGLCGLVYLQNACQRLDAEERARLAIETVVWDVVVLDGRRVDVHESSLYGSHQGAYSSSSGGGGGTGDTKGTLTTTRGGGDFDNDLPESLIREQVLAATSADARITVHTSTAKIITVDITGSQPPPPIAPPPGVELVELGPLHAPTEGGGSSTRPVSVASSSAAGQETTYRIVFRINTSDASASLTAMPAAASAAAPVNVVEQLDDSSSSSSSDQVSLSAGETAEQSDAQQTARDDDAGMPDWSSSVSASTVTARTTPPASPPSAQPSIVNQKKVRQPAFGTAAAPSSSSTSLASSSRTPHLVPAKPRVSRRVSSGSSTASAPPATTTRPTASSSSNTTTSSEKKNAMGFRAVLKRSNMRHKDATTTQPSTTASSSSARNKDTTGRTTPSGPPPPPAPPLKKAKSSSSPSSSGTAAQTTHGASLAPAIRQPVPPPRRSSSSQKAQITQMVRTPLTSRALFRHESPTPGSRDGNNNDDANANASSAATYLRPRPNMTADDLESLASLASLASTFADNISMQHHAAARGGGGGGGDDYDARQTLAVPTGGAASTSTSRPGTANGSSPQSHHRSRANRNSIYTLHTNDSQTSLILSAYGPAGRRSGLYENFGGPGSGPPSSANTATNPMNPASPDPLDEVRRTGRVPGMFPAKPLLHNLQRYMRFSSAAYGRDFLRAMGISSSSFGGGTATTPGGKLDVAMAQQRPPHHHEIASYAKHTGVAPDDIVMASFIDAKGGPDAAGQTRMPLVHYITLDHASKAVVLACRGTLGFEDILADMACAYDSLYWRGRTYQVHKGIHASARRLLYGGDGRVLATLRDALLRYPDYGLVLCGHSLGGAVTALLGVMLSEPRPQAAGISIGGGQLSGQFFQTKSMPPRLLVSEGHNGVPGGGGSGSGREVPSLPPGRPVHVYAYAPPGTMSPGLCKVTRGLITSIVQGNDLVPFLSLGVLHDFQAVALAFKTDDSQASAELWGRLWDKLRRTLAQKWWSSKAGADSSSHADPLLQKDATGDVDDDAWAYAALKTLRATMLSQKLLPPGEVLMVETQRVLQRTTYGGGSASSAPFLMVSPARRVVLKYVRDVEARFREIRFGLAAFGDHSPGRYERALDQLVAGVQL